MIIVSLNTTSSHFGPGDPLVSMWMNRHKQTDSFTLLSLLSRLLIGSLSNRRHTHTHTHTILSIAHTGVVLTDVQMVLVSCAQAHWAPRDPVCMLLLLLL